MPSMNIATVTAASTTTTIIISISISIIIIIIISISIIILIETTDGTSSHSGRHPPLCRHSGSFWCMEEE